MVDPRRAWPVLLASLALAACGGDDEESAGAGTTTAGDQATEERSSPKAETGESTEASPSKDEVAKGGAKGYRQRANALCAADEKAAEAVPEPATPEGIVPYFKKILRLSERTEPRYRALRPPRRLRRAHAAYLEEGDRAQKLVRDLIDDIEGGGDPAQVTRDVLPELGRLVDRSNRQARRLGLKECVEEIAPQAESPESTS